MRIGPHHCSQVPRRHAGTASAIALPYCCTSPVRLSNQYMQSNDYSTTVQQSSYGYVLKTIIQLSLCAFSTMANEMENLFNPAGTLHAHRSFPASSASHLHEGHAIAIHRGTAEHRSLRVNPRGGFQARGQSRPHHRRGEERFRPGRLRLTVAGKQKERYFFYQSR